MRIGLVSGIAGRGDSSLICPVPDAETLPFIFVFKSYHIKSCQNDVKMH